jgi:hypothetical protein
MKKSVNFVGLKIQKFMGCKKKARPSVEGLFSMAMTMLVPDHILADFEMLDAQ